MQTISVYLYPNKLDVYTNSLASWQLERYRRVYNRNLKVYRGVDNRIDLQVRNSDQKATEITGTALVFTVLSRDTKEILLQKDCSIVSMSTGKAYVTLTETELTNINSGSYNFSIVQEIRDTLDLDEYTINGRTPMYIDSQYGIIGTLEVSGDAFGDILNSLSITKFEYLNPATTGYNDPKHYHSSIIDTKNIDTASSLHTFQIYSTNYTGTVKIQGSLDDSATPSVWADIETFTLTNSDSSYKNVVGKWNWLKVTHFPTTGTVDKILYR